MGAERYNLFTGCEGAKTATFVLRGGSQQFLDEADRSLHDAIMIVRRALKNAAVLAGGGANDMEISRHLRCRPGCRLQFSPERGGTLQRASVLLSHRLVVRYEALPHSVAARGKLMPSSSAQWSLTSCFKHLSYQMP